MPAFGPLMAIRHRPYESGGDEDQANADVCALNADAHDGAYVELMEVYLGDSDYGEHHHVGARDYEPFLHAYEHVSGYLAIGA